MATGKIRNESSGLVGYQCNKGLNRFFSTSTRYLGSWPPRHVNTYCYSIVNHSANNETKDMVWADGDQLYIYAEIAQAITVRYVSVGW